MDKFIFKHVDLAHSVTALLETNVQQMEGLILKLCQEENDVHVQGLLIRIVHLLGITFHDEESSAQYSLVNSWLEVFLNNSKPVSSLDVALIMDASVAVMQYRQNDEGFVFQLMGKCLLEGILRIILALPQCLLRTDVSIQEPS